MTYSDGEVFALSYSAWGWLASAQTTPSGAPQAIELAPLIQYNGLGGAAQQPTGGTLAGGTYTYSTSYDNDLRLGSRSVVLASTGTTLYSTSRGYDAVGNVTNVSTALAAGTDSQAFCYDEQNRLVWASSQTATGPCGAANTAGTLTSQGATYTASYTYDALNRLTSSPLGSYTYGDPAHLHAVTAVANGYTASYNHAGALSCRAPSSGATCAAPVGSQTGAGLGYTNEGQLDGWQNTPAGTPTTTAHVAYDGEGTAGMAPLATCSIGPSTRSPDSSASVPTRGREMAYSCRSLVICQPPGAATLFAGRSIQA